METTTESTLNHETPYTRKTYEYTITFLKYGKIKRMTLEAESREDARLAFWSRIEEMQAFTESGTTPFAILSIR